MELLIFPILCAVATFIIGFIAGRISKSLPKYTEIGRFVINDGDPTKSAFWLELDHDLDVIERQDIIGLKVLFHSPPKNDD